MKLPYSPLAVVAFYFYRRKCRPAVKKGALHPGRTTVGDEDVETAVKLLDYGVHGFLDGLQGRHVNLARQTVRKLDLLRKRKLAGIFGNKKFIKKEFLSGNGSEMRSLLGPTELQDIRLGNIDTGQLPLLQNKLSKDHDPILSDLNTHDLVQVGTPGDFDIDIKYLRQMPRTKMKTKPQEAAELERKVREQEEMLERQRDDAARREALLKLETVRIERDLAEQARREKEDRMKKEIETKAKLKKMGRCPIGYELISQLD
ncbi:hypothetical protein F4779DRAFT_637484 [Xylariaceae sp. FL0662B]|nr:hypothetical protein F4779DRAFT_637484 [Xylariaceae sp. FL0662B]